MIGDLVPPQILSVIDWGWTKGASALWLDSAPLRGRPKYRVEWTDEQQMTHSVLADSPNHQDVGPLIRLLDRAHQEIGWLVEHLVWMINRSRTLIWYSVRGGGKQYGVVLRE